MPKNLTLIYWKGEKYYLGKGFQPVVGARRLTNKKAFLINGDGMRRKFYWKSLIILTGLLISCFHTCAVEAARIHEYPIPTSGSLPNGITSGPDGALWFLEYSANKIGRIHPKTHVITEYAIPTPNSGAFTSITSGPDGALWFTEGGGGDAPDGANQIGRIDPQTHVITEYATPTPKSGPAYITSGPDGALWFTEPFANKIGRINPTTHVITEYAIPTSNSTPWGITSGPDGALWFTEAFGNKIGQVVRTSAVSSMLLFLLNSTP